MSLYGAGNTKGQVHTIDHTSVGELLTDFPYLIRLGDLDTQLHDAALSDFQDSQCYDSGGSLLSRDITRYDGILDEGEMFVAVDISNLVDTTIQIEVGNGASQGNDTATWTGAGYTGVWPLDGSNTDRVGVNNLTAVGALPSTEGGVVGNAQRFNGSGYYDMSDTPTYVRKELGARISFWVKRNDPHIKPYPTLFALRSDQVQGFVCLSSVLPPYNYLSFGNNDSSFLRRRVNADFVDNLTKISINVGSDNSYEIYYNAVLKPTEASGGFQPIAQINNIGAFKNDTSTSFEGLLDHFTIQDGTKSAAWEQREYNNQSTFSTNGIFALELRRKKSIFIPVLINLVKRANV